MDEIRFTLLQPVTIIALSSDTYKHRGFVDAITWSIKGVEYRVVFWSNGERRTEWMYENELKA